MDSLDRERLALTVLMVSAGLTHLTTPRPYDAIVPRSLPGPARRWTYGSGVAELAVAAALAVPRTRRAGGFAAAALLVAVFPADIQLAWDWRRRAAWQRAAVYCRLPLQIPLIWWGLRVARRHAAGRSGFAGPTASRQPSRHDRRAPG